MESYINRKFKFIFLSFLVFIIQFNITTGQSKNDKNQLEILFLGSSYFGSNDLPNLFKNLAGNAQKNIFIDNYNPGGLYLEDHVNSTISKAKIEERKWDFIILQGVGSLMAYPDYYTHHPVYPALVSLKNIIHNNCPSTRIIFCLPWAYEDGMTWLGWPDTYEDMQILIYDRTLNYSGSIGFTIAPVGWAWYKVLKEDHYPLHYLHMSDWNHPSLKGSYLMACVIYSTLFVESCENNTYYSTISVSEAKRFQETASNIVMEDTLLWNISSYTDSTTTEITDTIAADTTTITNIHYLNTDFVLNNFPNPFQKKTYITYELLNKNDVEISVYNLSGIKVKSFINKNQLPGHYKFEFDGSALNNGTYLIKLKAGNNVQTKFIQKAE